LEQCKLKREAWKRKKHKRRFIRAATGQNPAVHSVPTPGLDSISYHYKAKDKPK